MSNKQILLLLFSFIFSLSAFAQISKGGTPPSFSNKTTLRSVDPVINVPVNLDIERLIWEDEIAERNGNSTKVAEVFPFELDIQNTGQWTTFSDSLKVWKQTIVVEGARGLIISYKDFYIPEGAKLFIYNEDHSQILGAYTRSTHPEGGEFATEVIAGEKITLEYVASTISDESPRIKIKDIGYIYSDKILLRSVPKLNTSESCILNINCGAGANWQKQKRGAVLLLIKQNAKWGACSGSLINNTKRDGTPYILTADHCFVGDFVVKYDEMIVYFNYEFPGCENELVAPSISQTVVGVDLLVSEPIEETRVGSSFVLRGADAALLKAKNNIPLEYKVFFNGWDRRDIASQSGAVIHHPNYDVKKITNYNKLIETTTYDGTDKYGNRLVGMTNGSWMVEYDGISVSQEGSSGAPLFNEEGFIIGILSGGSSRCATPLFPDIYGKFSANWDSLEGANRQLKMYLDPINEGNRILKGYDPNYPSGIEHEIVDNSPKEIVVFPTMVDTEVHINTSSIIRSVKVYDLAGRQVYSNSAYNASTTTINVDGWQKGVYSVVVETELKKLTEKFVKK